MSYEKITAKGLEPAKIRFYYSVLDLFNSLSLRTTQRANSIKDQKGDVMLDDVSISQDEMDIVKELIESAINRIGAVLFKIAQGVSNSFFHNSKLALINTISAVTIVEGGTGYVVGDMLSIEDGTASGGVVKVSTVADGVVTAVTLETGGSNYTTGTKSTTNNSGAGVGCTIGVTTVAASSDTLEAESSGFELKDNTAYNTNLLPVIDKEIKACIRNFCMYEWYGIVGLDKDYQIQKQNYEESMRFVSKYTFQLRKPTMS
jgi:hypothetical protein